MADEKKPIKKSPRRDPYRLTGETFGGRYRLEEFAGMGSFGAVYRTTDTRVGRTVAVKILKPDLGDDETEGARELFQREALTAGRLSHPHIVAVTDVGEESDFAYLVMEWLEGTTLEDELRTRIPFSPEETAQLLAPMTDALQIAHNAGVIHRDIKPSNIHLGRRDRPFVKVLDFGIAKVVTSSTAVAASRIAGTVSYMSPEQIVGSRIDRRTDIYSLGILLYQMLTGEVPFKGESQGHIIQQHIAATPPSLSEARPDLPPALSQVIQRALNKLPEARQQSTHELYTEFAAALKSRNDSQTAERIRPPSEQKTEVLPQPPKPAAQMPPTVLAEQRIESPQMPPLLRFGQQPTLPVPPAAFTNNARTPPFQPTPFHHATPLVAQHGLTPNQNMILMTLLAVAGAILFPLASLLSARAVLHNWYFLDNPRFGFVMVNIGLCGLLFGIIAAALREASHVMLFAIGGAILLWLFSLIAPDLIRAQWAFDEIHRYRYLLIHHLIVGSIFGLAVCALRSPAGRNSGTQSQMIYGAACALILMIVVYIYQITTYPARSSADFSEYSTYNEPAHYARFEQAIKFFFAEKITLLIICAVVGFIGGFIIARMRNSYQKIVR